MPGLRRYVALSDHWSAKVAKRLYLAITAFTLPAPRLITWPMLHTFIFLREVYYFFIRVIVCEPLLKAYCTKYGKGVRTGVYVHWIRGKGALILGDNVLVDGKCGISFATRYAEIPKLIIGNNSGIGHGCSFVVATEISIGRDCRIASSVHMFDSPGHPADPAARLTGLPPSPEDIRPIRIGNNVWIGSRSTIFPGVTIGDGSVIATGSVVMNNVPPNSLMAGNPARRIRSLVSLQSATNDRLAADAESNICAADAGSLC